MSKWKLLVCFIMLFRRIKIFEQSLCVFYAKYLYIKKKKINCPDNLIYYTTIICSQLLFVNAARQSRACSINLTAGFLTFPGGIEMEH